MFSQVSSKSVSISISRLSKTVKGYILRNKMALWIGIFMHKEVKHK